MLNIKCQKIVILFFPLFICAVCFCGVDLVSCCSLQLMLPSSSSSSSSLSLSLSLLLLLMLLLLLLLLLLFHLLLHYMSCMSKRWFSFIFFCVEVCHFIISCCNILFVIFVMLLTS